mmetsp:Transcript_29620/g.65667  ORF Transcript_29620/g.65667 Transcript_29620/m.65667 type:complete len:328 (-) Transcript_29620:430-1413(-)
MAYYIWQMEYEGLPCYPNMRTLHLFGVHGSEPLAGLLAVLPRGEGGQTQELGTPGPEARTRDGDHLDGLEDLGEGVPRVLPLHVHEYVGPVDPPVARKAQLLHGGLEQLGVLQVVVDKHIDLRQALVVQAGHTAPLHDVGGAVEGGAHHAVPVVAHQSPVCELECVGHHGPAQTHTCESRVLREGVDLDGHVPGPLYLVDGLGHPWRADEGRVGCVEHDERALLFAEGHQVLQLLSGGHRASGVVGGTDVVHVGTGGLAHIGEEVVFGRAGHVDQVVELLRIRVHTGGLSHHDGCVYVDGVGGVLHRADHLGAEHHLQARNVALSAV